MIELLSPHQRLEDSFRYEKVTDEVVCSLDPLGLDDFLLGELPKVNRLKDNKTLLKAIQQTTFPRLILNDDILAARAVTRDLGFMVASFVTNGGNVRDISTAMDRLEEASGITSEVPRDTVYSYGLRNPQNNRMRTFTDVAEERTFIHSFTKAMTGLPDCVVSLQKARDLFEDPTTVVRNLQCARQSFSGMADSILEVQAAVPPAIFTHELRPYFPPMTIGGVVYFAPGGAQMPVMLMDTILWASRGEGKLVASFSAYYHDNIQYIPRSLREAATKLTSQKSLYDHFLQIKDQPEYHEVGLEIARFAIEVGKFRYPHLKVAQANMKIRPTESVGSGGYDLDILNVLIQNIQSTRGNSKDYH